MISEQIKATGELQMVLRDKNGNIKVERQEKNLVVTVGKSYIARRATVATDAVMSHMSVGRDITAPIASHTALLDELGRAVLLSSTVSSNTITYSALFADGVGTGAITEAGIFNDDTAGVMLSRTVFPVINKEIDDTLTVNWQITVS